MTVRWTALKSSMASRLASAAADRATGLLRLALIAALLAAVVGLTADGARADFGNGDRGSGSGGAEPQIVERAVEIEIAEPTVSVPTNRDATIELPFTARDRHGYRTLPPGPLDITVTGPNGEPVDKERIRVSRPRGDDTHPRIQITVVNADPPLPPGRYTVRATYGDLFAEVQFDIAGPPATIQLRVDANTSYYVRSSVLTVTATVLDANGAIVPDGAEVAFTVEGDLSMRNVARYTDETTTSGKASARYIITGDAGTATFSATSGEASGSVLVELGAFPPSFSLVASTESEPEPATGKAALSSTGPGLSSWTSTAETTASALYAELAMDGLINLWIQDQSTWLLYGLDNGALIPGSVDFTIRQGAILYLFYADIP